MSKAYSLIELLIGVAILMVLISISTKVFFRYKQKVLVSQVQQKLENCLGELTADFADKGILDKECTFSNSNSTCNFTLTNVNGTYMIFPTTCNVTVENIHVTCQIEHFANNNLAMVECNSTQ